MSVLSNFEKVTEVLEKGVGTSFAKAVCLSSRNGDIKYSHSINTNPDSYYDLASITKIVTLTLLLNNLKRVGGDFKDSYYSIYRKYGTPIDSLEELSAKSIERLNHITLEDILLHRSGIMEWYPFYAGTSFNETLDYVLKDTSPVSGMVYSDIGFMLVGLLVASLSGEGLQEALLHLNRYLGTNFMYNPPGNLDIVETEKGNRIEMEMCKERNLSFNPYPPVRTGWRDTDEFMVGEVNDGNAFYAMGGISGHAGIFGRAEDLLALCQMYISAYYGEDAGYLSSDFAGYALTYKLDERCPGFDAGKVYSPGVGHSGFTGTAIYINDKTGVSSVLLTNRLVIPGPPDIQDLRQLVFSLLDKDR